MARQPASMIFSTNTLEQQPNIECDDASLKIHLKNALTQCIGVHKTIHILYILIFKFFDSV